MLFEGLYHPLEYDSRWDEGEGSGGRGSVGHFAEVINIL